MPGPVPDIPMMNQPRRALEQSQELDPLIQPMHMAIVIAGLGAGGAERVVSLLAGGWVSKGHRITMITFEEEGAPVFHQLDPGVRVLRLGNRVGRGRLGAVRTVLRRYLRLRRTLNSLQPDVTISFLTKINVLTMLASLGTGRKVVISERNNPQLQHASRLWTWALRRLHWRADAIVMPTSASLECLDAAARKRAAIIPNPITIDVARRVEGAEFVLAATGRLTWQKGFDLLLDAFARIAERHPKWKLVIWGEGEERAALEQRIRDRGLAHRVTMPGNSRSPEEWVRQADAFVLSSRHEGFSNALGEALVAGLPVASFDCAYGPADMIRHGENGLLAANGDVSALAAELDRLMGDADLRLRLGRAARSIEQRLRPSTIVARWEQLVQQLAAR